MSLPRLLLSAAHKSSGKTTIGLALCAALRRRGLAVQPFKKGPDYIDPMWLARASARDCFNLDPFLMSQAEILATFHAAAASADISLVEGNKGLYDGLALDGSNSNAALAHTLGLPVLLVLDAKGMTRGIAPLILGYQAFDRNIHIGGVILNNLGGSRHEAKLRAVIEHYTDVPVLGAVAQDERLRVTERHLGLMPHCELDDATRRIDAMAALVSDQVDLPQVIALARSAQALPAPETPATTPADAQRTAVRIGIARDQVFGFYYADDLATMERAGATLVPFDTLRDARLPQVDGLFIGGGFPEMFMDQLEGNVSLRQEIASAIDAGLPAYAECGGLMYLARTLQWQGRTACMAGVIGADVKMHDKPVGRGYVLLEPTAQHPWGGAAASPRKAHEFHYSKLENLDPGLRFAYRVKRGYGIDGANDGIVHRNLLASYAHLRSMQGDEWPFRFVAHVRACKASRNGSASGSVSSMHSVAHVALV